MVKASRDPGESGNENSAFFRNQAAHAIACLLFFAAVQGEDMHFVYTALTNPREGGEGKPFGYQDYIRVLRSRKFHDVADALAGLVATEPRQRN